MSSLDFAVCIPTYNAGAQAGDLVAALQTQTARPTRIVVVDSGSSDGTTDSFAAAGAEIHRIRQADFDHGETRQLLLTLTHPSPIVVYLTQDAIPCASDCLEKLVAPFADASIAASYARQLPRAAATPIEAHARLFNYRSISHIKSINDVARLGIKTVFLSNSCAAYRRDVLFSIGGFPSMNIFGEDMYAAGQMLLRGYRIAYVAEAGVQHSHDYSLSQEFRRYFDVGVFQARNRWLEEEFGSATGEGLRFLKSEIRYLVRRAPWLIPAAFLRNALKILAVKLGRAERYVPRGLKPTLSLNRAFWAKTDSHTSLSARPAPEPGLRASGSENVEHGQTSVRPNG